MNTQEIGIAIIGAGLRSRVARLLFPLDKKLKLKGIFDPDESRARERMESLGFPEARICSTAEEAIHLDGVDWVMDHQSQLLLLFRVGILL